MCVEPGQSSSLHLVAMEIDKAGGPRYVLSVFNTSLTAMVTTPLWKIYWTWPGTPQVLRVVSQLARMGTKRGED